MSTHRQHGFILLLSLIALIVVAVVSSLLINVYSLQQRQLTDMQRLLQAQTAAHSGMQWAKYDVLQEAARQSQCDTPDTVQLQFRSGQTDFDVAVDCAVTLVTEPSRTYPIYRLIVTAQAGQMAQTNFVHYQLEDVVRDCC